MSNVGEIKLTTNYAVLLRYDGPKQPFVVRTLPRTDANIARLKRLAQTRCIELLTEPVQNSRINPS
ncbi:MAG: hypothetical protein KDA52_08110 [Planctomycetaceae bacterium]|nr:hypothetical protein [Planctomycetaceae bacterium]